MNNIGQTTWEEKQWPVEAAVLEAEIICLLSLSNCGNTVFRDLKIGCQNFKWNWAKKLDRFCSGTSTFGLTQQDRAPSVTTHCNRRGEILREGMVDRLFVFERIAEGSWAVLPDVAQNTPYKKKSHGKYIHLQKYPISKISHNTFENFSLKVRD